MKIKSIASRLRPIAIGASMADMALLLLVFFMATTTTEPPKGVEVNLPRALTSGAEQDNLYITVSARGTIYFEGHIVSISELNDSLANRQREKDKTVAITADKNLNYSIISEMLSVLQDQDFLNIVFMSEPKSSREI